MGFGVCHAAEVERRFSVDEARALMPDVLLRAEQLIATRADLVELSNDLNHGVPSHLGGRAEVKALEARLDDLLSSVPASGHRGQGLGSAAARLPW